MFNELEHQPVLFRSSLTAPAPGAAPPVDAAAVPAGRQLGAAALQPASSGSSSWRRRQPKTPKLQGMVAVVGLSVGLTAVLYSLTGEPAKVYSGSHVG